MQRLILVPAILILAVQPSLWCQAQKGTAAGKGRLAVLERLDQNIGKAVEGVTLTTKQKASLDKDRQALRMAASARRDGLNEDKKATDKALGDLEKVFKDKKLKLDASLRQTVQEDVAKLRADSRNEPKRTTRAPRGPSPFPGPRRIPRW